MKKIVAILLVLLSAFPAFAETYTLEEGTYRIGPDIKPGTYEIEISSWGFLDLLNPDGSYKEDLYKYDTYTFEGGDQIRVDWGTVTLKSITVSAEQAASEHYQNLLEARLEAEAINYEGVDALRYALPSGTYTVGKDIPAGSWQVRYFSVRDCTFTIVHEGKTTTINIVSPKASNYDPARSVATAYFPLYEGDAVTVGETMGGLFLIPFQRDLNDW